LQRRGIKCCKLLRAWLRMRGWREARIFDIEAS
jgi:hypothetical protein